MNPDMTPEQRADIEQRVAAFREEYLALVDKYQVDFASYPQFVQNREGSFSVISNMSVIDKKFAPVPSTITE